MNENNWMLGPNQPNWEAIYKELNENGIDNLQNLPMGIIEQMNNLPNRPLGPISGDSQMDQNWLQNTTIEELVTKARKEKGIYNDIELKEPPKPPSLLETFQQSHEKNKINAFNFNPIQPVAEVKELETVPKQISNPTVVETQPMTDYEKALMNKDLDMLNDELPNIKAKEAEERLIQEQKAQADAQLKQRMDNALEKAKERKEQAVNYKPESKPVQSTTSTQGQADAYEEAARKGEIYASHKEALYMNEQFDKNVAYEEAARKGEIYASHKEALYMNEQFDKDLMHKEALSMNEEFDKNKAAEIKRWESHKEATSDARFDVESNVQIAEEALADEMRRNVDSSVINDAKIDLAHANQNRDNFYNEREYSLKEAQWRKNNPEAAKALDAKRALRDNGNEAAEKALKNEIEEQAAKNLKKSTMKNFGHVMNLGLGIMDYKDSREAGNSVGKSVAKAGIEFAKGEIFGGWYMAAMVAKSAPTMVMSTMEGVNSMSRSMNSLQRRQVFGDSQFQDTQQLATMRQSGMELAKMSQYNLQQSLMGNEAEYMHRL